MLKTHLLLGKLVPAVANAPSDRALRFALELCEPRRFAAFTAHGLPYSNSAYFSDDNSIAVEADVFYDSNFNCGGESNASYDDIGDASIDGDISMGWLYSDVVDGNPTPPFKLYGSASSYVDNYETDGSDRTNAEGDGYYTGEYSQAAGCGFSATAEGSTGSLDDPYSVTAGSALYLNTLSSPSWSIGASASGSDGESTGSGSAGGGATDQGSITGTADAQGNSAGASFSGSFNNSVLYGANATTGSASASATTWGGPSSSADASTHATSDSGSATVDGSFTGSGDVSGGAGSSCSTYDGTHRPAAQGGGGASGINQSDVSVSILYDANVTLLGRSGVANDSSYAAAGAPVLAAYTYSYSNASADFNDTGATHTFVAGNSGASQTTGGFGSSTGWADSSFSSSAGTGTINGGASSTNGGNAQNTRDLGIGNGDSASLSASVMSAVPDSTTGSSSATSTHQFNISVTSGVSSTSANASLSVQADSTSHDSTADVHGSFSTTVPITLDPVTGQLNLPLGTLSLSLSGSYYSGHSSSGSASLSFALDTDADGVPDTSVFNGSVSISLDSSTAGATASAGGDWSLSDFTVSGHSVSLSTGTIHTTATPGSTDVLYMNCSYSIQGNAQANTLGATFNYSS